MSPNAPAFWQDLKSLAQSLLYENQQTCPLCKNLAVKGKVFCWDCEEGYFHPELNRCRHCGKLIGADQKICRDCAEGKGPTGLVKVVAWGHYTGAWREFIQAIKFKSQPYLLERISTSLADFAIGHLPPPNFLVPVPMHPERLAERGYNQAAGIASLLHWELGIPLYEELQRVRPTIQQVGLSRQERLHNLEGVFKLSPTAQKHIEGARIWLIDDVTTTGATLEFCAEELKRNGASQIYGLVLAAGLDEGIQKGAIQSPDSVI